MKEEVPRRVGSWWTSDGLRIGAHRGDVERAPENTMAAFQAAAAAGADYIEMDVQRSADGVLVVIHDPELARTTDGRGPVADRPARELFELDAGSWFGPDYAGQRIPSFDAFLDWLAESGLGAMVEAKAPGTGAEIAARLAARAFRERLAICSFSGAELEAAKRTDGDVPCFLILPRTLPGPELVARARRWRADGVNVPWQGLDGGLVAELRAAGLMVTAGTANRPEAIAALVGLGVDGVDTDRLRMALAARAAARHSAPLP